jgi:hypothetical protein
MNWDLFTSAARKQVAENLGTEEIKAYFKTFDSKPDKFVVELNRVYFRDLRLSNPGILMLRINKGERGLYISLSNE